MKTSSPATSGNDPSTGRRFYSLWCIFVVLIVFHLGTVTTIPYLLLSSASVSSTQDDPELESPNRLSTNQAQNSRNFETQRQKRQLHDSHKDDEGTVAQFPTKESQSLQIPHPQDSAKNSTTLRLAFVGNSILFYHDTPGMLVHMIQASGRKVVYECCLRSGSSLLTIRENHMAKRRGGGGCNPKFTIVDKNLTLQTLLGTSLDLSLQQQLATPSSHHWDFVILNDQTKVPATPIFHQRTMTQLKQVYAPELLERLQSSCKPPATNVALEIWAITNK